MAKFQNKLLFPYFALGYFMDSAVQAATTSIDYANNPATFLLMRYIFANTP